MGCVKPDRNPGRTTQQRIDRDDGTVLVARAAPSAARLTMLLDYSEVSPDPWISGRGSVGIPAANKAVIPPATYETLVKHISVSKFAAEAPR